MKVVLLGLLLSIVFAIADLSASQTDVELYGELENLKKSERIVLVKTLKRAEAFDMQWTMTAIAWRESHFGRNLVGRTTPDYGVFQINIVSFKRRYAEHLKVFPLSDESIIEILKNDYNLGFVAALAELEYWKSVRGDNWFEIWASYNGGHKMYKPYAKMIKQRIKVLKKFLRKNPRFIENNS